MGRLARALVRFVSLAFSRDHLDAAPAPARSGRRRSLLALVFAREVLPLDEPASPAPRQSLARLLLAPEHLPFDAGPPLPPRRRSTWLRWLLAREPLDSP